MTGEVSADPGLLDAWVRDSRALDEAVVRQRSGLGYLHQGFVASSRWGSFNASPLIDSLGAYAGYNESDARWTSNIAAKFRAADSGELGGTAGVGGAGAGMLRMSGAALNAGLIKDGMSTSISGSRVLETLSDARVGRNAAGLIETVDGQPVEEFLRSLSARRAGQALDAGQPTAPGAGDRVTSVGLNRQTGEVIEGDPVDVVARAGEAGTSRIAHAAGARPSEATRLAVAHEQVEMAEHWQGAGEAALVPAMLGAARASLGGLPPGASGKAALEARLAKMSSRIGGSKGESADKPTAEAAGPPEGARGDPGLRSTDADRQAYRNRKGMFSYEAGAEHVRNVAAQHPVFHGIPEEDLAGVHSYTTDEWFAKVNKAFRDGDTATLEKYRAEIRVTVSGLSQLPAYEGTVYRTVSPETDEELQSILAKYKSGITVTERQFLSSHKNAGVGQITFVIKSRTGRDIELISNSPNEQEVLFAPGTRFDVIGEPTPIGDQGYRRWVIELNEVE